METKTKKFKSLLKVSEKALQALENHIERVQRETEELRVETEKKRKELAELQAQNNRHLQDLGWTGLTDEEMLWLKDNYKKEWHFFRPTLEGIRERYAERTKQKYEPIPMDPKFKGFEEYQVLNGWLDPDGRYYPVKNFAEHDGWAWDYLHKKLGPLGAGELISKAHGSATDALQNQGWVRIMKWDAVDVKFVFNENKITASQKDSLYLYCALHCVPLPFSKEF